MVDMGFAPHAALWKTIRFRRTSTPLNQKNYAEPILLLKTTNQAHHRPTRGARQLLPNATESSSFSRLEIFMALVCSGIPDTTGKPARQPNLNERQAMRRNAGRRATDKLFEPVTSVIFFRSSGHDRQA